MEKKIKPFTAELLKLLGEETMCSIQHNGCPCNTCFHTWAESELGLSSDMAHLFWLVVLALRGDYAEREIMWSNQDNFKKLIKGKVAKKLK